MKRDPGGTDVLEKSLELSRLLLAFGRVERVIYHEDGTTTETDTDHTVMLGVMACAFAREFLPHLTSGKIAEFALVHDLVEVYAGDTPTFRKISDADEKEKKEREAAALARIKREYDGMFPWIGETIEAYERLDTPEARFVKFFDKVLPKLTHVLNRGAKVRELGHTKVMVEEFHAEQRAKIMKGYGKDHPEVEALYLAVTERLVRDCFPDA